MLSGGQISGSCQPLPLQGPTVSLLQIMTGSIRDGTYFAQDHGACTWAIWDPSQSTPGVGWCRVRQACACGVGGLVLDTDEPQILCTENLIVTTAVRAATLSPSGRTPPEALWTRPSFFSKER